MNCIRGAASALGLGLFALACAILCVAVSAPAARAQPAPAGRCAPVSCFVPPSDEGEECTTAILSGESTRDGRPILWKNRDTGYVNNEVVYFEDGLYRYVAVVNAGDPYQAWVGVNERGFAIMNALSYNLPDTVVGGITNGQLMKVALQRCATVLDFDNYMRELNKGAGRENPANLAVIDALGGAAVFEAAGRDFVRFDAKDAPGGFLVRTNYSLSADTSASDTWRYHRCTNLVKKGIAGTGIDVGYMLQTVSRDLCARNCNPYPLPFAGAPPGYPGAYGYVETSNTINRRTSVSGGAVVGVHVGESPLLSTFYPVVGHPVVTIPIPVWVAAGRTPPALDGKTTSPLCDLAQERTRASYDGPYYQLINTFKLVSADPLEAGFMTRAERVERWLLPETDMWVEQWRRTGPDPAEMADVEWRLAARAFDHYRADVRPASPESGTLALAASPNPARGAVAIRFDAATDLPASWSIRVIDPSGRQVALLDPAGAGLRSGILRWDGRDDRGAAVASGTYFLKPSWPAGAAARSVVILR